MKAWIYLILPYIVTLTMGVSLRHKRSGGGGRGFVVSTTSKKLFGEDQYNFWICNRIFSKLLCIIKSCRGRSWPSNWCLGCESRFAVNIAPLIKPPLKLKNGEKKHPAPGWRHCIKAIKATDQWRLINTNLPRLQPSQFQCTWIIQSVRSDGLKLNRQIQISIQKLTLGALDESRCQQQFVEIIDHGKSQGRFCGKVKPGDYISIDGTVRIDVQVEGSNDKSEIKKQVPVAISYRSIPDALPGFRSFTSKLTSSSYDRSHISTTGVRKNLNIDSTSDDKTASNDEGIEDEDEVSSSNLLLSVGEIVGIAVCGILVLTATVFVIASRCCCVREKVDQDKPLHEESTDDVEKQQKPISLPRTQLPSNSCDSEPPLPPYEVVIASEVVSLSKKRNSSSASSKKKLSKVSAIKSKVVEKTHNDIASLKKTSKKNGQAEKQISQRGRSRKKTTDENARNSKKKKRKSSEKVKRSKSESNKNDRNVRKIRYSSGKKKRSKSESNKNKDRDKKHLSLRRKIRSKSGSNKRDKNSRKEQSDSGKKHDNNKDDQNFMPARRAEKKSKKNSDRKTAAKEDNKTKRSSSKKKTSATDKNNSRLKMRYKRISSTKDKTKKGRERISKEKGKTKPSDPTPATRYRKKSKTKSKD